MNALWGFTLSDRTRIMAFMRCGSDHHSIALADADSNTLNHIAFVMPDLDAVMRGAGRMSDAGYPIEWGGRHGPGNNVVFLLHRSGRFRHRKYTAEVLQVDDSYRVGKPEDWTRRRAASTSGRIEAAIGPHQAGAEKIRFTHQ
jgi:catechol 2,3-dioxygenase